MNAKKKHGEEDWQLVCLSFCEKSEGKNSLSRVEVNNCCREAIADIFERKSRYSVSMKEVNNLKSLLKKFGAIAEIREDVFEIRPNSLDEAFSSKKEETVQVEVQPKPIVKESGRLKTIKFKLSKASASREEVEKIMSYTEEEKDNCRKSGKDIIDIPVITREFKEFCIYTLNFNETNQSKFRKILDLAQLENKDGFDILSTPKDKGEIISKYLEL